MIAQALDELVHNGMWMFMASVVICSALLFHIRPDSRPTLRKTLYFLVFSVFGLAAAGLAESAGYVRTAAILQPSFILASGAAIIRLGGLFVFRIVFESMHIRPPSILEEIIVVIAYFAWAMLQLLSAGVPLGEIVTTSAVATAILAFAMQDTLGNILGGLSLQWDHSLTVGDWIHVDDIEGKIVDVKWRAISVETRNWETVVIPNSMMMQKHFKVLGARTGESVKWRRWVWFHIDFSVPPERVISIAQRAVTEANIPCVSFTPPPNCLLMDIDHSVGRYAMRYWLTDLAVDDPTDSMVRQHIYAAMNREQIRLAMPRKHLYITNKDESYQQRKQEDEIKRRLKAVSEVDLFHTLSNDELANLAERVEYRPYAHSDVIFREGTTDPWLYIIISGQAEIHIRAESGATEHSFTLGPGDFFGELGLMTGAPRSATVVAGSALETYRLGKRDFTEMLQSRADMIEEISHIMVTRQTALQKARDHLQETSTHHSSDHSVHELVDKIKQFIGLGN